MQPTDTTALATLLPDFRGMAAEVSEHLPRLAGRAHGLPQRLPAGHGAALLAGAHDDFALAGRSSAGLPPDQDTVADFTRREMIAYLLLIHISRMFSSMPGLAAGICRDVRDGSLKKYLVQPLDMIGYLISYRAAHKTAYITTSAIPYAVLFLVCSSYFDRFPDPLTMAGYLVSLLMGFLIGFFFECAARLEA